MDRRQSLFANIVLMALLLFVIGMLAFIAAEVSSVSEKIDARDAYMQKLIEGSVE